MEWLAWTGFAVSLACILLLSKRSLALGLFVGTIALALFCVSAGDTFEAALATLIDPTVIALAFIVALIPIIGGIFEESGKMDDLVENLRIGKRAFIALAPAILGMLPMPGGALLSAPLVEKVAPEGNADLKSAVNVWFRHILYMVYPISTVLIATAAVAGISLYTAIGHLSPFFFLSIVLGWFFFLRQFKGVRSFSRPFSWRGLALPLGLILTAPAVDIFVKWLLPMRVPELATLLGVSLALVFTVAATRWWGSELLETGVRMKVWNYSLIILAMFFFVNVFTASPVPGLLGSLAIPDWAFLVGVGFVLGFATGRIQAPMFVLIPIHMAKAGAASMDPWAFAVSYFAIFLGYAIAPAHPCVTVSIEYFKGDLKGLVGRMAAPVAMGLLFSFVFAFVML